MAATRLPARQRREQFLDVAAELVLERGADGVTMEGVAARAGVSKGLGYAYFANRDELLLSLFDREASRLDEAMGEAFGAEGSFEGRIRATLHVFLDVLAERGPLLARLLQASSVQGPVEDRRRARQQASEAFVARQIEAEFAISRKVAATAATILMKGVEGAIEAWLDGRGSRRTIEETFVRMSMGSLAALGQDR